MFSIRNNLCSLAATVLLFSFFSSSMKVCAQHPHQGVTHVRETSLIVTSDQNAFWLFLDDVLQNEQSVRSIQLDYVPEGDHYLRVELDDPDHRTVGQLVRVDMAHRNFRVERSRHLLGLSLGYGAPRPELVMTMVSAQPNRPYGVGQSQWFGYHPAGNMQPNVTIVVPPAAPVPPAGPVAMSAADFQEALAMVKRESFETTRCSTAKQIVKSNHLTVSQIEQLCRVFDFDNTKLDFAKFAYPYCVDPEHYYLLHNVFSFESNKRALDDFIEKQR